MSSETQASDSGAPATNRRVSFAKVALMCVVATAVVSIALNGLIILATKVALGPRGGMDPFLVALCLAPNALLAVIAAMVCVPCFGIEQARKAASIILACAMVYLAGAYECFQIAKDVRAKAFHQLAARSAGLVRAIESYHDQRQRYPDHLEDLVPDFLPSVPTTGMGACPEYTYVVNPENPEWYKGNPYIVCVNRPSYIRS
ncbi:MAG: hypothetical protein HZB26_04050 [Candidatus Hydrogenedentes bacterium]|nr:hypothetical protein [Candidatus Hydrogenedentota bacterium]